MSGWEEPVMVVEDERVSRTALTTLLRANGYHAEPYESAEEALRELEHGRRPAAVLVDVDLPGMSGLDLVCHIRRLAPQSLAVFITASEPGPINRLFQDRLVGYLRKPLDFDRLLNLLDHSGPCH